MKKNYKIIYHAFTDEQDEYFKTEKEAFACIKEWKKEGYQNLRIRTMLEYDLGELFEDNCIYSKGGFPI